jgi:hypothetical protein
MATTVTLKPNAIDLSGSTSGTTTLQASAVAGTTTVTLPAVTDTLVGKTTTDTLTNKTLTAPVINTIINTGTLTLPTSTDTLVGRATTDTLTNKTLTSPIIGGTPTGVGILTSGTAVASTSGTSIDFTSIPSWVKRITVMFNGVSTSGTSSHLFQLGSGSVQTTGYTSATTVNLTTAAAFTSTAGMISFCDNAVYVKYGAFVFTSFGSNTWVVTGDAINNVATAFSTYTAGQVTLAGTLDRVRITTVNGTDTFDAGSINILYE